MAQFKYCWEFLIIHFFSLVSFSGSHLFSTSAILVSLTDLHDFPQLFILSGCSPLSNLFHIYHFHILLVSLPSYLQYLELSARPSFPRCPQFSPFHASLGVGTWGQGMPVLCWCEQLCAAFPGWLQVSWHSELCSPGWACMQVTEEVSPLLSSPLWPVENFHSTWYFWIPCSLSKLKFSWWTQEVCWRQDGEERRQCVHVNLVFIWDQAKMKVQSTQMCENKQVTLCTWCV